MYIPICTIDPPRQRTAYNKNPRTVNLEEVTFVVCIPFHLSHCTMLYCLRQTGSFEVYFTLGYYHVLIKLQRNLDLENLNPIVKTRYTQISLTKYSL